MTKNPEIPLFTASVLLDLSLSVGKYRDLDRNIEHFIRQLNELLVFDASEIWYRDASSGDRNYYRIYESAEAIVRTGVFEYKNKIAQFAEDQHCHISLIEGKKRGSFDGFTNLTQGVIYTFKLSEQVLLIAYHAHFSSPLAESAFNSLYPIFQNLGISIEQGYINKKTEENSISPPGTTEELQKYKLVVDNVSEGLLICNLKQEVVFANNQLSKLSEYPTEEIIGKPLGKLLLNDARIPEMNRMMDKVFNGSSLEHSIEHTRKISQTRWWATAKISPYKNTEGLIVGAIAIIRDITIEKLTQQALKESQDRYNLLIDHGFDGVVVYDLEKEKLLSINDNLLKNFGYGRVEFNSLALEAVSPEKQSNGLSSSKYLKQINAQINEEGKLSYEWTHRRKDGSLFYVDVIAVKLLSPNQHIKIEIHKDITERYLSQKALQESEERMSKFFDMSPIPILIRSTDSLRFNLVNKKFTELFGYTVEELNDLNRHDLVYQEDAEEISIKMKQLLSGEISDFRIEKQYIRKDGSIFWGTATRSLVRVKGETLLIGFIEDVTLQKEAIAAMKESEAKLRAIFDSTEDKILAIDRNFKLIDFNKSGVKFLERYYHRQPFKIGDQYPPPDSKVYDLWVEYFKAALQGQSITESLHYSYLHEERVDLVNILPIKGDKGDVIGITVYGKDITQLNNTQKALQTSENQLKEAQRIARIGNWEYDFDTEKIAWSEGTYRIFEMPTDAAPPTFEEYQKMILPEDRQKLLDGMAQTLLAGQPYEYEIRHFTRSGKMIYTVAKGEALMEGDKVVKIFGTVQDITSQKKVELELKESNHKYQDLFHNMYDALMVTNKDGYFRDANEAAQRLLEYSLEELHAIRIPDIVHPDDKEKSDKYLQQLLTEGFYSNYQGRIITKSGKVKYLQVNSNAIIEQGKIIGSRDIARDITALKEAEEKREQLYAKLEIVNKELKDFAYIVSHDLKAPLRAIGSLSRWLAEDYQDLFDAEGQKHLSLLIGRANRMQKFIEGILQYSRIGRIDLVKEPVNIRELLDTVIDSLAPPEQFTIVIDEHIPVIAGEKIRIQQVFQNLISNAIKYNDKSQGIIKITYDASTTFHQFTIADNGPGIEEKHFDKIFKIFQTLHSRDQLESTGIGLTIVKRIVELHGGIINVSSKLGEGSKFTFTIKK